MAMVAVLFLVVGLGATAARGSVDWQTTDGDALTIDGNWEDSANWLDSSTLENRIPIGGDTVNVKNGGTVLVSDLTGTVPASGNFSTLELRPGNILQTGSVVNATMWMGGTGVGSTYTLQGGTLNGDGTARQIDLTGRNATGEVSHFIQTGGTANIGTLRMDYKGSKGKAYFEVVDGVCNINSIKMAYDLASVSTAVVTVTGGNLTVANNILMGLTVGDGSAAPGEASVHVDGGDLIIKGTTPFTFAVHTQPVYVDLNGGALNLKGTWDFATLTTIANSDFRVAGEAATESNLIFEETLLFGVTYTRITGLIITGVPGDTNDDGVVDAADYIALKTHIGTTTGATLAEGDLDGNGTVDWADLDIMTTALNSAGGAHVAPEPMTFFVMMAAGLPALLKRRRSRG